MDGRGELCLLIAITRSPTILKIEVLNVDMEGS